jgi:hypothetical protein
LEQPREVARHVRRRMDAHRRQISRARTARTCIADASTTC